MLNAATNGAARYLDLTAVSPGYSNEYKTKFTPDATETRRAYVRVSLNPIHLCSAGESIVPDGIGTQLVRTDLQYVAAC